MRRAVLVVLLYGCSGSPHAMVDGGPDPGGPDAAVDAGTDAGSGSGSGSDGDGGVAATDVRVLVRDGFAPIAGVRVIFDGSDGTRTELATDATGAATATMAAGGDVTVIRTYQTAQQFPEIYSYVAVKPGEILHVGHVIDDVTTPAPITVVVPAGAQGRVEVTSPCGSGQGNGPNVPVTVVACPPKVAFYVQDSAGESFVAKVPYATSVDLSQQILADFLSTTIRAYNVTPDLASVTAEARAMDGTHALYSTGVTRVDQGSTQSALPNLALATDELIIGTRVATAGGTQVVASRSIWEPMPVSIDASRGVLPYLEQPASFTAAGATWVEDGTGTVDAVIATIAVTRANPATPADAQYRRTIIAPYSGESLAIPQLTGADATYNPIDTDQLAGSVGLIGSTAGYDSLRPWAFGVANIIDATPLNQTFTVSYADGSPPTL